MFDATPLSLRQVLACVAALALLGGCAPEPVPVTPMPAAEPPAPPALPAPKRVERNLAKLFLLSANVDPAAIENVVWDEGQEQLAQRDAENGLFRSCGLTAPPPLRKGAAAEQALTPLWAKPLETSPHIDPAVKAISADKTRRWDVPSINFDLYALLSNSKSGIMDRRHDAKACLRYSRYRMAAAEDGAERPELASDMLLAFRFDARFPEILKVMPLRLYFRDFTALAESERQSSAAFQISAKMTTVFTERNQGFSRKTLDDELLVTKVAAGNARQLYQLYDQETVPAATIPLPPWDYETKGNEPKHNYTIFALRVTETRDLPWLIANVGALWPNHEYEATPAFHIEAELPRYQMSVVNGN